MHLQTSLIKGFSLNINILYRRETRNFFDVFLIAIDKNGKGVHFGFSFILGLD